MHHVLIRSWDQPCAMSHGTRPPREKRPRRQWRQSPCHDRASIRGAFFRRGSPCVLRRVAHRPIRRVASYRSTSTQYDGMIGGRAAYLVSHGRWIYRVAQHRATISNEELKRGLSKRTGGKYIGTVDSAHLPDATPLPERRAFFRPSAFAKFSRLERRFMESYREFSEKLDRRDRTFDLMINVWIMPAIIARLRFMRIIILWQDL